MPNTRRAKIEEMLREEPDDVFLRYSLAMEMCSEGEEDNALKLFAALCDETPPHVPAFFRSAQVHADQERWEAAREFLRRGIAAAREQNDLHAAAEMSEMLSELGAYDE